MIIPLGGGGSKVVASIVVTYPAGSTCTCTLGSKVLTAQDTSGKWVFGLPSTGSWVVKAVKGSQSKSATVNITAEGQTKNVTLSYELVLLDNTSGGLATGYSLSGMNITPAIDLTNYTLATIKGSVIYTYAEGYYTTWGLRKNSTGDLVASFMLNYNKNFSIDVSALTGSYFFGNASGDIRLTNNAIQNDSTVAIGQVEYIKFS